MVTYKFEISGLVQGVGFRPFVYSLAVEFGLKGEIYNDDSGVKLTLFGEENEILNFENALLKRLPPLARVYNIKKTKSDECFSELRIIPSKSAKKSSAILPDFALCADCEREFHDKTNSRYKYAFINCTNCGPRFSIIKSLPYDRVNTTMSEFKMCKHCQSEYENPLDRRYHAQPISCKQCGPKLMLKDKNKNILAIDDDAIIKVVKLIKDGKILAIKGLGGFHLVCNARNESAIKELRKRKNRPQKPFAIMCKNLQNVKKIAEVSDREQELLSSNLKPIVLLKAKKGHDLALSLAPNLNSFGVMLPFSGIHLAIFEYFDGDIVATSANISGEPVIFNENELLRGLSGVIDFYLDHDRDIYSPSDDSIAFIANDKTHFLRTSRGLNPKFISTKFKKKVTFLALGAELKNQFVIYHDGQIMVSPYIGDLKNVATFERFLSVLELFKNTYELKFDFVVGDLHPYFLNTKWAIKQGLKVYRVQHHYAHLLAVMFENNLKHNKKYIGFCFDGTGFGSDGKIWGGEVFKLANKDCKRIYHFDELTLIGGENSIKNIYQIAYSIILKYDLESDAAEFLSKFDHKKLSMLKSAYKISKLKTSSLGRIFDAFASIILDLNSISYEAESGMKLDVFYDENLEYSYEFNIANGIIEYKDAFSKILKDDKTHAATGFINAIANLVVEISKEQNCDVLLSGGVFQNSSLFKRIAKNLKDNNISFYTCNNFGNNDSNIALGQAFFILSEI